MEALTEAAVCRAFWTLQRGTTSVQARWPGALDVCEHPRSGPERTLSRPRPDLRPHAAGRRRDGRTVPTHTHDGDRTRARTSVTWASAIALTAGPETPPVCPPSHGSPGRRGCGAMPRNVLISETASAPCCSAAAATSAGDAVFGVSLTINGLVVCGRTASSRWASSTGSAPNIRPVLTFGQETLSSSAVTSSRSAKARTRVATSSAVLPMTLTISGTGSSESCGRSCARNCSRPLLGGRSSSAGRRGARTGAAAGCPGAARA